MNQFTQAKKDGMKYGFFVPSAGWFYYRTLDEAVDARPKNTLKIYDMDGRIVVSGVYKPKEA